MLSLFGGKGIVTGRALHLSCGARNADNDERLDVSMNGNSDGDGQICDEADADTKKVGNVEGFSCLPSASPSHGRSMADVSKYIARSPVSRSSASTTCLSSCSCSDCLPHHVNQHIQDEITYIRWQIISMASAPSSNCDRQRWLSIHYRRSSISSPLGYNQRDM